MTDYNSIASADIRRYVWDQIVSKNLLDDSNYYADGFMEPLVPIIPTQQVPEFNNLLPGKTYIIYDFDVRTIPVQWWMSEEGMTMTIISQSYDKITQIANFLNDTFRRYDESARDINAYFGTNSDFIFHHTQIDSIMSPEPYNTEGDYQMASVSFSYHYSRKTRADGRF